MIPKADVRFIVLLWGDKLSLNKELVKGIPLYDYNDIVELGRGSRHTLLHSSKPGISLFIPSTISVDILTYTEFHEKWILGDMIMLF